MKKVIELIRVSTLEQAGDDRASIPAQRAVNRRTAKTYRESKRRILAVTVPEIRVSNYQVRGISVTSPSFCGEDVTRSRAGSLIATNPERIFIPLNL